MKKEIIQLKKIGISDLCISDDQIGNRPPEFWYEMAELDVGFFLPNGVNLNILIQDGSVNYDLVDAMILGGVKELALPFESGSSRIIKKWSSGKWDPENTPVSVLHELCDAFAERGVTPEGYYMIGFPDETLEEAYMTHDLAKELVRNGNLASSTFFICTPFPCSKMYEIVKQNGQIREGTQYRDFRIGVPIMDTPIGAERILSFRKEWYREINDPIYVQERTSRDIL